MLERTPSVEPRKAYGHAAYRLSERRRTRRRRFFFALLVLFLLLLSAGVYGLQQSTVRISHIAVIGADASLSAYATDAMRGSYFGIIPRDSIFFFPEGRIRAEILASNNDIAAVSMWRNGFTGISIKTDYRVPIARWCGSDPTRFNLENSDLRLNLVADCYLFDANGLIYSATTTLQPINSFVVYEALSDDAEPIGSVLPFAKDFPSVFDFARQLSTLGSPVISVSIHEGEADNLLASGTRITYVLGREQDAFTALVSARDNFNLADGSVDYIDLRFNGKVYLKRKE